MLNFYRITLCFLLSVLATLNVYAAPNPRSIELNEKAVAAVKANDFKSAEKLFKSALASDSGNLTAAFNLAGMYLTNQKFSQAINLLQQYTDANPKDAGLWSRLGDAYFSNKEIAKAISSYKQSLALDGNNLEATKRLATVYSLTNDSKNAEILLRKAHSLDPRDAQTAANLSSLLLVNEKPDEAVTYAKRAIQLSPSKEVYITLGTAYEILKDYKNALIAFERAQDLGDNSKALTSKIDDLKKVTS
ncbi:MAG: tetratricopeptide repeat protein [Bdellovibrionales bacterium]|nr:tetratricopeptide repeat protein [Bdellovibrionales bacterium]